MRKITAFLILAVMVSSSNANLIAIANNENLTQERCEEVRTEFFQVGNWTQRYGNIQEPAACKDLFFPNAWFLDPQPEPQVDEQLLRCEEVKSLWEQGDWTARFGDDSEPAECKSLYFKNDWVDPQPEPKPAQPTFAKCKVVRDLFNAGNWTQRFGSTDEPAECKKLYYNNSNWIIPKAKPKPKPAQPTFARCQVVRDLYNEGNWTERFGSTDEPAECKKLYYNKTNWIIPKAQPKPQLQINHVEYYQRYNKVDDVILMRLCNRSDIDYKAGRLGDIQVKAEMNSNTVQFSINQDVAARRCIDVPDYEVFYKLFSSGPIRSDYYDMSFKILNPGFSNSSFDFFKKTYIINPQESRVKNLSSEIKLAPAAGYEDEVVTNPMDFDNPFPDTNLNSLEGKAGSELFRRGVIGGYPDGEFKGERPVNRAEAAKFLLLARYGDVDDLLNNDRFPDVKEGEWYVKFVINAANKGIINGYPDGLYRPQNTVTTAEFLKMLTLTFNLETNLEHGFADVPSDQWFAQYAGTAQKYNLFPSKVENLNPDQELTRTEVAIAIYQYLSKK